MTRKKFFDAVDKGVSGMHAVRHAGSSERALRRIVAHGHRVRAMMEQGVALSEDDKFCAEFLAEYERRRANVVVESMGIIQDVSRGGHLVRRRTFTPRGGGDPYVEEEFTTPDYRAADTVLKRGFPGEFEAAAQFDVTITGPQGGPIQVSAVSEAALAVAKQTVAAIERGDDVMPPDEVDDDDIMDAEVVDDDQAPGAE